MEISRSDKLLAAVALLLLVAPGLLFWTRLPDPLATHWFNGRIVGGLAFAQASIVEANLDAPSWSSSDPLNVTLATVAFLGAWLIFGLLTYAVERR